MDKIIPNEYKLPLKVASYDVGANDVMRLSAVLRYQQEAGEQHLVDAGLGWQDMMQMGMVFVTSRWHTVIHRLPAMEERVTLAMDAILWKPRVTAGRMIPFRESTCPLTGNHLRFTAKTRIRIRPNQKVGQEIPMMAINIEALSKNVFCLTAAMMPKGSAKRIEIRLAHKASLMVLGNRDQISVETLIRLE